MTAETVINVGQQALLVLLLVSAPLLLSALALGLLIGMFQAATQINEMTISFIPKILGIVVALMIGGPWILQTIVNYTQKLIQEIPFLIG